MPAPAVKIELGLDLDTNDPTSFTLDSVTKGVLNNTTFTLGGPKFFDITDRLVTASVRRGKSQALDRIDSGVAAITLDNSDRLFDPLNPNGTYFGQLIPRREVKISSNDIPVMFGFIDDFDIQYEPGKQSVVRIDISDAFSAFANSQLDGLTPDSELSGARINRILDLPEVSWPSDRREIDPGNTLMLDATISEDTETLSYLQLVESSELGTLFIGKGGRVVFRERNSVPNVVNLVFSDDPTPGPLTAIQFADVNIVYGSENLYNRIVLANADAIPDEVIAEDAESQALYGVRTYSQTGVLVQDPSDLQFLANFLLARFKEPQYRFETVTVVLDTLTESEQDLVLDLEIGDIVQVRFQPSDIPPAIEQNCRVIGINQDWNSASKNITFSLERLDFSIFILDNPALGVLDEDRLGYE